MLLYFRVQYSNVAKHRIKFASRRVHQKIYRSRLESQLSMWSLALFVWQLWSPIVHPRYVPFSEQHANIIVQTKLRNYTTRQTMSSISTVEIEILAQVITLILRLTVVWNKLFLHLRNLNYHRLKLKFRASTRLRMPLTRLLYRTL